IYSYSERTGTLAVLAQANCAIRKLAHLGLKVVQRGQSEAAFVFDPKLPPQVAAIIRATKKRPGA
ncbi:MAG: hypothetical protein PHU21_12885, partial [Elusimicrobia bacterium]|nr:hypothetical protein [Elusimicrobiota bacterium]